MAALWSVMPGAQAQTAPTNAQLIDKILANAQPGQKLVRSGDAYFEVEKLRALRGATTGRQAASAFYRVTYWPNGVVPYILDPSLGPAQRTGFIEAIRELETIARLTFVPRTTEADYIKVFRDVADTTEPNNSAIGKVGGEQLMRLGIFANRYTAAHEIMHALGIMHEQSRSNRDTFVTIDFTNIQANQQGNFAIVTDSDNHGPYDFDSVMHYGQSFFAIDPSKPNIIVKAPNQRFQNTIGQSDHISELDKVGLADIYGSLGPIVRPENDSFAAAQTIVGSSGSVAGNNKRATAEAGEPNHAASSSGNSVWYRWIPANNGVVTFTTAGTTIDTVIASYLGLSVNTLTNVTSNDDVSASDATSSMTFPAQAKAVYYIAVDSSSKIGATGDFTLNWNQNVIAARVKLTGTVKTSLGNPLSGVTVNLVGAEATNNTTTAKATTNSAGVYTFSNLLAGTYVVTCNRAGFSFLPTSRRVRLVANATNTSTGNDFTATEIPASQLPEMYISDVTLREGNLEAGFVTFNVSISTTSKDTVTVNYATANGTASSTSDYTGTRGTLSFAPGVTTLTVTVNLRPDTAVENNETFTVNLSNAAGAAIVKSTGVATLVNDD